MDFSDLTSEAMKELISSFNTNQYSGLLKFLENKFREDLITLSKEQGHTLTKCQIEMGVSDFMKDAHEALCDLLKSDECEEKKVEQEEEEKESIDYCEYFFSGPLEHGASFVSKSNKPIYKKINTIQECQKRCAGDKKGEWTMEETKFLKFGNDRIKLRTYTFVEAK